MEVFEKKSRAIVPCWLFGKNDNQDGERHI